LKKGGRPPFFYDINTYMKDKKAAKLIIKRAKQNPKLYTKQDVYYAKMIKKKLKDNGISHQETEQTQ